MNLLQSDSRLPPCPTREVIRPFAADAVPSPDASIYSRSALLARDARWQVNYFDHRLAAGESVLPVLLYIYLNPYRKHLIESSERWPWFYCHEDEWRWFKDRLADNLPEPDWLL